MMECKTCFSFTMYSQTIIKQELLNTVHFVTLLEFSSIFTFLMLPSYKFSISHCNSTSANCTRHLLLWVIRRARQTATARLYMVEENSIIIFMSTCYFLLNTFLLQKWPSMLRHAIRGNSEYKTTGLFYSLAQLSKSRLKTQFLMDCRMYFSILQLGHDRQLLDVYPILTQCHVSLFRHSFVMMHERILQLLF